MQRTFTLEYWQDKGWYVGRIREIPGVFSQGESLEALEDNIRDAYELVREDAEDSVRRDSKLKEIEVEV